MVFAGIAAAFALIGAGALLAPKTSARQFGLPTDDPVALACIRGMGARDLILGGIVAASLSDPVPLRRVLAWASVAGLSDAITVAMVRGLRPQHVLHLGGFAALLLAAVSVDVPPHLE